MKAKFLFLFLLFASPAWAANHYIRDGATGSTCADWGANACDVLPATLVRGDTYYLAAGNYVPYSFDDAQSGTTTITIKKATVADHGGQETGWLDSYATGQAIFTGGTIAQIGFDTGYYIIDGSPTNTKAATSGQGIKFDGSTCTRALSCTTIYFETGVGNITLKGIEVVGMGGQPGTDPDYLDQNYRCVTSACVNNTVQLSYFHHSSSTFFQINNSTNFLLEDTWVYLNYGNTATNHAECIGASGTSNVTIRRNIFEDCGGTAVIATGLNQTNDDSWKVYGNVFFYRNGNPNSKTGVDNGIFANTGSSVLSNSSFVNNTIINMDVGLSTRVYSVNGGTGNVSYNNLWYDNVTAAAIGFTSDYNYYILTTHTTTEANRQITPTTDPFVAWTSNDFHLVAATTAGTTLSAPYTTDPDNNIRGADSTWDRGAFEFLAGGGAGAIATLSSSALTPCSGQNARPGSATVCSTTLTLQNTGDATLTITSITLSSGLPFAQSNTCGATLAVAASCTITLTFTPQAAGAATQRTLTVTTDGGNPTCTLDGTGLTIPASMGVQ